MSEFDELKAFYEKAGLQYVGFDGYYYKFASVDGRRQRNVGRSPEAVHAQLDLVKRGVWGA